jgi:hypothetical protein
MSFNPVWVRARRLSQIALLVFGVTSLVIAAAASAGPSAATAPDPLAGVWRTAPVPVGKVRAAILASHFTQADVDAYLEEFGFTNAKSLQFHQHFYVYRGTPKVENKFWDSSKPVPCCGDQGPYKLLPSSRVAITSDNPTVNKYRYVFTYRVQANQLKLRFLSATNPGLSTKDLRFDKVVMVAFAAAPYARLK